MILAARIARRPAYVAMSGVISGAVIWLCMAGAASGIGSRATLFYLATAAAYALMPYVRRADIPLAAMWVVLAVELAPLTEGRLIDPWMVVADIAGVVMAATPIFIARARQVLQGDVRSNIIPSRKGDNAAA
jgi:hypothetical protein